MAFLEMRDVHKRYGDHPVLQGLNLSVNEHQVVCLIGPSGCGKSTLLRCINGLDPIQSGEIRLENDRVSGPGVDVNKLRQHFLPYFSPFGSCFRNAPVLVKLKQLGCLGQFRGCTLGTAHLVIHAPNGPLQLIIRSGCQLARIHIGSGNPVVDSRPDRHHDFTANGAASKRVPL